MRLIFVGEDCVKRISGDAIPDVEGGEVRDETPEVAGAPLALVKLIGGVMTVVEPPPLNSEELAAAAAKADRDAVVRKVFLVALNHENRIRVIEGKPQITAAQFRTALTEMW